MKKTREQIAEVVEEITHNLESSTEQLREAHRKIANVSRKAERHIRRLRDGVDEATGKFDIPPEK